LPAELVASGDSCGETFAGGFGAPGVSGVDKAVGDLPEQFSVFGTPGGRLVSTSSPPSPSSSAN
jgi:hypothetical protein